MDGDDDYPFAWFVFIKSDASISSLQRTMLNVSVSEMRVIQYYLFFSNLCKRPKLLVIVTFI